MKGKGKLVCRVGNLELHLHKYGTGMPIFMFKVVELNAASRGVEVEVPLEIFNAVFLNKCLSMAIDEAMAYNLKKDLLNDEEETD